MKTAVIYARYSSNNQREESIAGQLRECHAYAEREGYEVIHEYTDSALTGKSDQRPAFQKMILDSDTHAFEAVIVWKLDRFARNRYDAAMYRNKLSKNGVKIYSAMENISDSPEGIILEGLMESLAEYYSANLAENVKRGLYDSAIERKILGSPTFGYKRAPDGKYEIDPDTAPIIRRIFNEYVSGKPYMEIIRDLNRDGLRTIQGKPFSRNSLRRILRNEKYIGVYRYKDIFDPNGIPPIVDKETFEQAQLEIKKRSFSKPRKAPEGADTYLLSSILYCGHCDSPMVGESARSENGTIHRYYLCSTVKRRPGTCHKKRVQKELIENEVLRLLNDEILNDEFIEFLSEQIMNYLAEEHENETLNILESELKTVSKKISNLLAAMEAGIWSETTADRLHELETRRTNLERQISHEMITEPPFTIERLKTYLNALKNADRRDSGAQRFLIHSAIKRIYLFDDDDGTQRLVLDLNYGRDKKPVTLEKAVRIMRTHPSFFMPSRHLIASQSERKHLGLQIAEVFCLMRTVLSVWHWIVCCQRRFRYPFP